jgi:DNA modification methylase
LFVEHLVTVFREVRRVLRDDGTVWLNLGDSYATAAGPGWQGKNGQRSDRRFTAVRDNVPLREIARHAPPGLKPKDLVGIPWRVAFALQADGWWLRSAITWCKKSAMPESIQGRPTSATEMIFLLTKSARYFYDPLGFREPRDESAPNLRNFWLLGPEPYPMAHFATFPSEIPRRAILLGTSERGACPVCGAPWRRVVSRTGLRTIAAGMDGERPKLRARQAMGLASRRTALSASNSHNASTPQSPIVTTTGWTPTCAHDAAPVPCVVLDPFAGSGTVPSVAQRLGRIGVGVERKADYLALATRRIGAQGVLL